MTELKHENHISDAELDRLIAAHDGEVALLYIYRLRTGVLDTERTARDLCRTVREVEAAAEKLERLQTPHAAAQVPEPEVISDIPAYKTEDILRRLREDDRFAAVLAETEKVMGKPVSSPDLRILFGIYDHLGIPSEVLLLLINYCGMLFDRKYKGQRRPTIRSIQNEALLWVNNEIMTVDSAEQYMERQNERGIELAKIKELLGIRGRELVKSEAEKINAWLDMGFREDTIRIAYERTVTNTGSMKWNYMDKIIRSWKEKKLFTPEDIAEKDGRRPADNVRTNTGDMSRYFSDLDDVLNKI